MQQFPTLPLEVSVVVESDKIVLRIGDRPPHVGGFKLSAKAMKSVKAASGKLFSDEVHDFTTYLEREADLGDALGNLLDPSGEIRTKILEAYQNSAPLRLSLQLTLEDLDSKPWEFMRIHAKEAKVGRPIGALADLSVVRRSERSSRATASVNSKPCMALLTEPDLAGDARRIKSALTGSEFSSIDLFSSVISGPGRSQKPFEITHFIGHGGGGKYSFDGRDYEPSKFLERFLKGSRNHSVFLMFACASVKCADSDLLCGKTADEAFLDASGGIVVGTQGVFDFTTAYQVSVLLYLFVNRFGLPIDFAVAEVRRVVRFIDLIQRRYEGLEYCALQWRQPIVLTSKDTKPDAFFLRPPALPQEDWVDEDMMGESMLRMFSFFDILKLNFEQKLTNPDELSVIDRDLARMNLMLANTALDIVKRAAERG